MKTYIKKQINYFNEALLLASYICNTDETANLILPVDYKKMEISKAEFDKENEKIMSFFSLIRSEARNILKDFSGIEILFQRADDENSLEILYFLTYSRLKESIQFYSFEDLLDKIREDFIKNMDSLGYDTTTVMSFEEVDCLTLFNEQQRYMIYKLIYNINHTFDKLYEFILSLEKVIKKHENIIIDKINSQYTDLESKDILKIDDTNTLESVTETTGISGVEYTFFIQFPHLFGFSLFSEKENIQGYIFVGLVPYLMKDKPKSLEEKKDDMISKFALLSDTTRFNIMVLLSRKSMYGREIAAKLSISAGTISHHLSNLLKEGIIVSEIQGKRVYYSINQAEVNRMSRFLKQLGGNTDDE